MNPNEISILSDDLRPRDTPNHTLLKDFVLKPMVPDLSITEEPRSEEPCFPNRCQQPVQENSCSDVLNNYKPLLEDCKTYSEWRKRSALNAKPQPIAASVNCEKQYVHYVSGRSSPTVLDNLYTAAPVHTHDGHSATSLNGRPSNTYYKDSQVNGISMKVTQSAPRTVLQKSCEAVPVHMNSHRKKSGSEVSSPRQDSNFASPCRKSYSGNTANSNSEYSNNHFVNNHPESSKCMSCAHWTQQPMTAIGYNGMPVFDAYPHMGMPPCNRMPFKASSGLPVPSAKSRNVSSAVSGNSFSDSVLYDNLYQIVLSQSEQLKTLQTQVERLLINQENHKCNGSLVSERGNQNRHSTTVMERETQTSDGESNADDGEKMSIGVMTSFIHTVAYTGRVGIVDSRNKQANRNMATHSTSTSPASQVLPTSSSSSRSDRQPSPQSGTQNNCCKCHQCNDKERKNLIRKQRGNPDKGTQLDELEVAFGRKGPGVSTAIRTVRDCQAALESESFPSEGDNGRSDVGAGVDESITLNGADLPTVVELPVSPPSSMHIDVQEYDRSSSEDGDSSDDELSSLSETDDESDFRQDRPNGWNAYNNVLGPVDRHLGNKDSADVDYHLGRKKNVKSRAEKRENDPTPSAVNAPQVNTVLKRVAFQHEPKSKEENSAENLKELALKYLRENYPEELNSTEAYRPNLKPSGPYKRAQDMGLYNMGNNMSFATFRYLQRYNLLPDNLTVNRIEELPGCNEMATNVERRSVLTNGGSPSRNSPQVRAQAHLEELLETERVASHHKDRTTRHYNPHRKENRNPALFESPNGRKHSSKVRHKKHFRQTNPAPPPNGQQTSSNSKILDITALRQQPKLL